MCVPALFRYTMGHESASTATRKSMRYVTHYSNRVVQHIGHITVVYTLSSLALLASFFSPICLFGLYSALLWTQYVACRFSCFGPNESRCSVWCANKQVHIHTYYHRRIGRSISLSKKENENNIQCICYIDKILWKEYLHQLLILYNQCTTTNTINPTGSNKSVKDEFSEYYPI